MKILKKIALVLLCLLCFTRTVYGGTSAEDAKKAALEAYEGEKNLAGVTESLLSLGEAYPAGTSICDWTALAASLLGAEGDGAVYLEALNTYISENFPLSKSDRNPMATEWHRMALVVKALGGDPTACGVDGRVDLIAGGTYDYAGDSPGEQGLNGWIFALITLDSGNYEIPEGKSLTREAILKEILDAQEADGGFGLVRGSSDIDITAMALQALAPYADKEAREAVDQALAYLSAQMTEQCLFLYGDEPTSESSSQVIIALCALGIDPAEVEDFAKGGTNLLTALSENYQRSDGSYAHLTGDAEGDYMATEQALLAYTALWRMRGEEVRLYDLTGIETADTVKSKTISLPVMEGIGLALGAVAVIVLIIKKREKKA